MQRLVLTATVLLAGLGPARAEEPAREALRRQALALNEQAVQRHQQGNDPEAAALLERALAVCQRLYPEARFPHGHPDLAKTLHNLGAVRQELGEYDRARDHLERALAIRRHFYPESKFPEGQAEVAMTLNNLGSLLQEQGEYARALPYLEEAYSLRRRLYPEDRFPDGHSQLATSLNNLGFLLEVQGQHEKALDYYRRALAMRRRLYPASKYPDGHDLLATSLNNLGFVLHRQRQYDEARACYEEALAMYQRLYPEARSPRGHPDVARTLNNLGMLLHAQGEYARALPYLERAVAAYRKLYPEDRFPNGHPRLASTLGNLGTVLWTQGEGGRALDTFEQALAVSQRHLGHLAAVAPEAEALAFAEILPQTRDGVLSAALEVPGSDATAYRAVWRTKAAVTRVLERRHLARLAAHDSPATRARWQELLDTRRQLARVLAAPAADPGAHDRELRPLTDRREQLERDLAAALPPLPRLEEVDRLGPDDLGRRLPAGAAFVDLVRYTRLEQDRSRPGDAGLRRTEHYAAFVLAPGQPVRRAELGTAAEVDTALAGWQRDLAAGKEGGPAVRRLVWQPLRRLLPDDTRAVTLAPDGALGGLPWAALPGDRDGTVLLDDYRLALVPHGPFLLGRLLEPRRPTADPGRVLAVGGVDHGPAAGTGRGYPPLPGTAEEVRRVLALAGDRPATVLTGAEAGPDRLARELAGVRQAHLATHGYFDEAAFRREQERVRRQRQAWAFTPGRTTEPVGLGVRSPLGFTGLALAGANQSAAGVLTGEAIADLPLEGLDLVVLSACETGLGVAIRDEGAAGLQRAFHLAGARNVVAGLWQVPDVPTLVLMERFYANLWDKDQPLPSAEALRQAQLFVRGHPEAVRQRGEDLRRRGFGKELPPLPGGGKVEVVARSPALWWAGFALSGPGD